jgi:hypothetical protein
MTFLEAALKILSREGKPLHFKDLTERAMTKKLLTFVGRTPEVTMQTQLTAAVKKAPGNPFVRVKPGVFGLLRYPELPPEEPEAPAEPKAAAGRGEGERAEAGEGGEGRGRRRRRRGGRGRGRDEGTTSTTAASDASGGEGAGDSSDEGNEPNEPKVRGGLSAAARAAALATTGVLEGDDEEGSADAEGEDLMSEEETVENAGGTESAGRDADGAESDELEAGFAAGAAAADEAGDAGPLGDDEDDDDGDDAGEGEGAAATAGEGGAPRSEGAEGGEGGRRRRRRRRRRGGGEGFGEGGQRPSERSNEPGAGGDAGGATLEGAIASGSEGGSASGEERPAEGGASEESGPRRIMTPVDAAFEILRGQAPGRGMHVRQIAESAARRRLVHGEPNEAWRVMRAGLAAEPRERLRAGQRPRVRSAGAGLFSLARRPPDAELERAELVFGEARRALRERTIASLERRIADLSGPAFEALARVLIQREGFGPATFVKRVEGTVYVEALRGRGTRPSKTLIALRSGGGTAGRRAIGELRAGIRMRNQDEGLLMLAGRLGDDAIAEWKQDGRPIEIADGHAMAETCVRHGLGVLNAQVSVDFVDADFFAELAEG